MKKVLKIILIVVICILSVCLIAGGASYTILRNASNAEEYTIGNDTIKSVKSVVDKRKATSVSTKNSTGVKTKSVHYESDSVQEDLIAYVQYLREEADFNLTQDMDLRNIPSMVQMGKQSEDSGEILMLTIEYDTFGYTITLQKGKGTLTFYD